MIGIIYPSSGAAFGLQTAMNVQLGYPRAPSLRGYACPAALTGITTSCAGVVPHPTLPNQFALQESPEMLAVEGTVPLGAGVRTLLDVTWGVG